MTINYPANVLKIINTLEAAGYEAYAVGGCVRDVLIGREPHDWDITTSADPYTVKELFDHTIDTGLQHGTVTVMLDKDGYEVTTYRIDGEYEDSRHPKEVQFTSNLSEDLKRRDFTINAMAANESAGVVDLFGGQEDLKARIVRAVGNPVERFTEDALRILRAFRFSAQLGFEVDKETFEGAAQLASTLSRVSAERIREEINKLLLSEYPNRLLEARRAGVTAVVLPEFDLLTNRKKVVELVHDVGKGLAKKDAYAQENVYTAVFGEKQKLILKWAVIFSKYADTDEVKNLLVDEKREVIRTALNRFRFDNETRDTVLKLVMKHELGVPSVLPGRTEVSTDGEKSFSEEIEALLVKIRFLMHEVGPEIFDLYMELQRVLMCTFGDEADKAKWQAAYGAFLRVLSNRDPVAIKDLDINGRDLIAAGMAQGAAVGETLEVLLQNVLVNPRLNEKEKLLSLLTNIG